MSSRHRVVAGMTGNLLEWYDFALYSTFAGLFANLFFPGKDPVSSLIASFGVFASGYLMRPIGSVLFGRLADKQGRSRALIVSLVCISLPTVLMGLLPVYEQVGPISTVLLVLLRLVQGLSLGGEYTTSFTWLVEQAPRTKRGFFGSWASVGAVAGFALGTSMGALITLLPQTAVESWAWRIPFLLSGVFAVIGWRVRRQLRDEHEFKEESSKDVVKLLWENRQEIVRVATVNAVDAVGFYLFATYLVSELNMLMNLSMETVLRISTIALLTLMAVLPLSGALSDRWGRKRIALIAPMIILLFGRNIFSLTQASSPLSVLTGELIMALLLGLSGGVAPAWFVETTTRESRCTTLGVGYNISSALLGGLTPLAATLLVHHTGDMLSPVWLWQGAATLTLLSILSKVPKSV